jgi:hypothetical protein
MFAFIWEGSIIDNWETQVKTTGQALRLSGGLYV